MTGEFKVSELESIIKKLESIIEETWAGVKGDYKETIWWEEAEVKASFYHHLRSNRKFGNISEEYRLIPLPEYNPKPRGTAVEFAKKFGKGLYPEKTLELDKDKIHFDLVIAKFENLCEDQRKNLYNPDFTHWHVKHYPIVAMEFKYPLYPDRGGKDWITSQKNGIIADFKKLQQITKVCKTIKLCYFCFVAKSKLLPLPEEVEKENEEKFRIAYGLCDKSDGDSGRRKWEIADWKIDTLAKYKIYFPGAQE